MIRESSKKILVIEDDATTRNLFLDGLEAEGFVTIGAENGLVGIQQAEENLPDLVICDLIMPHIDGYGVLTKLRQNHFTAIIPFIFLTASNSKISMRKAMELGADDYLSKPSTVDELLKAISIRLEKQALFKNWYANKSPQISAVPDIVVNSESIFPTVPHLKKVFDYIELHFHQGITLSDVAEAVGYSPAYLTTLVGKETGESVNTWIVKRRMAAARPLLKNTNQTIEAVATKLGYQNACHFSRQFRQHHGLSPTIWRKQHQLVHVSANAKLQVIKSHSDLTNRISC
ncbi:response regulator [Anabaena cylindrica FACHB-243]|uniref:Two component transcriptional regulator, AraC family n=1 Tax=Anabaena cylindrica (strain ATCC 27899 / PCC 7122) TaxID=272123 RepID=K9ZD09_ANACC|nr:MULTISPECIES: response regulator [Anabaena]AFZ56235.1 two component transcriptional regulator, AraC family [Anabaena cylindrica PCC 7122]MBD2417462.1 response regulator [Anabaena cylindrica FACHB-243]MBY5285635.1 response regulator transcription factor [Anabaena sp. CCAP 1446/1C]MBY5310955.1 response regulator transcription factor [Anabaena sp. CCAP 1446/1C]MCM2407631.1 response regulator [Anabaena sp. CCAP 1446/1C]